MRTELTDGSQGILIVIFFVEIRTDNALEGCATTERGTRM